jgi:hypothetical protein
MSKERHDRAAIAAGSLSRRARGGVRGYALSRAWYPLTPTLSPVGRENLAVPKGTAVLPMQALHQRERDVHWWTFLSIF